MDLAVSLILYDATVKATVSRFAIPDKRFPEDGRPLRILRRIVMPLS
jgi:hypothetical protein